MGDQGPGEAGGALGLQDGEGVCSRSSPRLGLLSLSEPEECGLDVLCLGLGQKFLLTFP